MPHYLWLHPPPHLAIAALSVTSLGDLTVAQELLKLAGKQAVLVHDPDRQRPEMLPHELLQAETAARMPRSEALGSLLQSIVATSKVRQARCRP